MDIGMQQCDTGAAVYTILDAPGHVDFVPNMIRGTAQADACILVVSAAPNEFETGFGGGQTRDHASVSRALGISQVILAITKMDIVGYSEARYSEIKGIMEGYLLGLGFKKEFIQVVPVSGVDGGNLVQRPDETLFSWYPFSFTDSLVPPKRTLERPLRLPVSDCFKGGAANIGGAVSVGGRIEAGVLEVGDTLHVLPITESCIVRAIEFNNESVKIAYAGSNVLVTLSGIEVQNICIGDMLCDPSEHCPVVEVFKATIMTFDISVPITQGLPVVVHHQSAASPGIISKLVSVMNKKGQVTKHNPRCLLKNSTAVVEIQMVNPVCLELSKDYKELGRVVIRSGSVVVAAGIVTEIIKSKE